jgi:hypothetical protein
LKLQDAGGFGACEKTNNCASCGYRTNVTKYWSPFCSNDTFGDKVQ